MQVKITMRCHLTAVRMAIIKRPRCVSEHVEEKRNYELVMGMQTGIATMEVPQAYSNSMAVPQKMKNSTTI